MLGVVGEGGGQRCSFYPSCMAAKPLSGMPVKNTIYFFYLLCCELFFFLFSLLSLSLCASLDRVSSARERERGEEREGGVCVFWYGLQHRKRQMHTNTSMAKHTWIITTAITTAVVKEKEKKEAIMRWQLLTVIIIIFGEREGVPSKSFFPPSFSNCLLCDVYVRVGAFLCVFFCSSRSSDSRTKANKDEEDARKKNRRQCLRSSTRSVCHSCDDAAFAAHWRTQLEQCDSAATAPSASPSRGTATNINRCMRGIARCTTAVGVTFCLLSLKPS